MNFFRFCLVKPYFFQFDPDPKSSPINFHSVGRNRGLVGLPSGKRLHNYGKSAFLNIFHGKTHYKWPFSIAFCMSRWHPQRQRRGTQQWPPDGKILKRKSWENM